MKQIKLFLMSLMLIILAACGNGGMTNDTDVNDNTNTSQQEKVAAFPVTITDGTDKEIIIEKQPEKIISLMPSNTEILYALGVGENMIGVSDADNYPEEVNELEDMATNLELNVEKIVAAEPDLVLIHMSSFFMWEQGLKQIEENGITVVAVPDASTFDQVYETIELIGQVVGKTTDAETIIAKMKSDLQAIEDQAKEIKETKSVFVEISPAPEIYSTGTGTFMNEMLQVIQAKNVVEEEGWPLMNEEAIIDLNPDVILTQYGPGAKDAVLERSGWEEVTAIKEQQVFEVNEDLVSRPGPRIIEGVEELAKAIYPETFK